MSSQTPWFGWGQEYPERKQHYDSSELKNKMKKRTQG